MTPQSETPLDLCDVHRKGRSHAMATAKFPESFSRTRITLPRLVRKTEGTATDSSTRDPSGIKTSLDNRAPLRLMFSDWVGISRAANLTNTGNWTEYRVSRPGVALRADKLFSTQNGFHCGQKIPADIELENISFRPVA